ncbi:MAG: hypothetical protein IKG46_05615 [Solobacterium sp.]|nr:hypothetical protein [Solobacterium sp.]
MAETIRMTCSTRLFDLFELKDRLCTMNAELVGKEYREYSHEEVLVLVFEKYYMRSSGYGSLTVMLEDDGEEQRAVLIASGGGQGIMNISYGANRKFAESAAEILQECDFMEIA